MLHAPRLCNVMPHAYSAGAITVNRLHVVHIVHNEGAKKRARWKGSESGKCCTRAWDSHVASGVESGQVAPPFMEGETLLYFGFIIAGTRV